MKLTGIVVTFTVGDEAYIGTHRHHLPLTVKVTTVPVSFVNFYSW